MVRIYIGTASPSCGLLRGPGWQYDDSSLAACIYTGRSRPPLTARSLKASAGFGLAALVVLGIHGEWDSAVCRRRPRKSTSSGQPYIRLVFSTMPGLPRCNVFGRASVAIGMQRSSLHIALSHNCYLSGCRAARHKTHDSQTLLLEPYTALHAHAVHQAINHPEASVPHVLTKLAKMWSLL